MSENQLSKMDTEAPRAAWEMDPERQAVAQALGSDRKRVLAGAWAITCIQVFLLAIAIPHRDIPRFDLLTLGSWCAIQVVLSVSLHLVPQKYIYRFIVGWLTLIGIALAAQLSVFYFGPEREAILNGTLPVLAITIPLVIVLAGTILKRGDALCYGTTGLLTLMFITSLHAWLYWDQANTHYAMTLMLLIVFLVSPLTLMLQMEQRRIHSVYMRTLQRKATAEHEASVRFQQEHVHDPLTHLLNRVGISEALDALLNQQAATAIAFLSITNAQSMRRHSGEFGYEDLLCRTATSLQNRVQYAGRQDAADFVIWSNAEIDASVWQAQIDHLAETLVEELSSDSFRPMIVAVADTYESGTLPAVALEDLSFRSTSAAARG